MSNFEETYIRIDDRTSLHAWVLPPKDRSQRAPFVSLAPGFAGLKYRGLNRFAKVFNDAGFGVIAHDHRNFGLSTGPVRGDIDPWQQIDDWRKVISFATTQEWVDPERMGLWGSSYSGGHVLVLAATDDRVKTVVSQVPTISGYEQSLRRLTPEKRKIFNRLMQDDHIAQLNGKPPMRQQVVSLDPNIQAAYYDPAMVNYYASFELPADVDGAEQITLRSTQKAQNYDPGIWISRNPLKPFLMIVGRQDSTTPFDLAARAFKDAPYGSRIKVFQGGHYDAYLENFEEVSRHAVDWLRETL